jgi:predicted nucleic acid-binding protein
MKLSSGEFRAWDRKAVTLLGMSGVGKTRLARILRRCNWFHYSGDYRIGTRYLGEAILAEVKREAMLNPRLRDLLRSDAIHIANNISVDNLKPLSAFLGKVGDPERGGLGLREFRRRQELYRQAEIAAMKDVPAFINGAWDVYGYRSFVNDAGGSLCELGEPGLIDMLAQHTLILYVHASDEDRAELIRRAEADPKPLYYPEAFLDRHLAEYMQAHGLEYVALIDPDDFVRWVFPRLFADRLPRYQAIADRHGYTVSSSDVAAVRDEADFVELVERALAAPAPRRLEQA